MLLMIDNYDSFTYNLVQYFGELGQEVKVVRNDAMSVAEVGALKPDHIVLSPGPCTPNEAGISLPVLEQLGRARCRCSASAWATRASARPSAARWCAPRRIMHGKTSMIHHKGEGAFTGLPSPFEATRYHSLVVEQDSLPECLEITAWTENEDGSFDEIMGLVTRPCRSRACSSTRNRS